MKLSHIIRNTNSNVFNQFKLTLNEAPNYLNSMKQANKELVYKKFTELNNWYTKTLGLDEVKFYQDRVISLQEKLLQAQEKRREISRQLTEIRKNSNELQDKLHKIKRHDNLELYLSLMKDETEVLKMENEINKIFQDYDLMERELFTAFINAIRDSHEKQRAQLEYTKYFGLILSITGTLLAMFYTMVWKNDMKKFIEQKINNTASTTTTTPTLVEKILNNNNQVILKKIHESQTELKHFILKKTVNNILSESAVNNNNDGFYEFYNRNRRFFYAGGFLVGVYILSKF